MPSETNNPLDRIRIVLVRPQRPGNIGAAARALMNMGISDFVLVAPDCDWRDQEAVRFAARAVPLLESVRVAPGIAEAQADCVRTFATSGKGGMYRRNAGLTLSQAAPLILRACTQGPVSIAFGPEDRGLLLEETLRFDHVIEIPAAPEYPVLNLATAVAVVAYELRRAVGADSDGTTGGTRDQPLAPHERTEAMFVRLFDALDQIGFFRGQQYPEHLKYALRHMLGRAELSINETDILIGMARQILWTVNKSRTDERSG